jgi:hypothetical protein
MRVVLPDAFSMFLIGAKNHICQILLREQEGYFPLKGLDLSNPGILIQTLCFRLALESIFLSRTINNWEIRRTA